MTIDTQRRGPGRKPEPNKRQSITVRLPPDVVAWLGQFGRKKGEQIEAALRREMERAQKSPR